MYRGWAIGLGGGAEEGIALTRDGLAAYRAAGNGITQEHMLATLAESLWAAGEHDPALAALEEAASLETSTGETYYEPELHRLRGELLRERAQGSADSAALLASAEASVHEALDIARRRGAKSFELRAAMSLCRVRRDPGDATGERRMLADVYGWFTEGLDTPDLRDARILLDELETD